MYVYPFTEEDSLLLTSFSAIGVSEQEIFERIEKEKKIVRKKSYEPSLIKEGMRNDRYYRFQRREILDDPKLESLLIDTSQQLSIMIKVNLNKNLPQKNSV